MNNKQQTWIGGNNIQFPATQWTFIQSKPDDGQILEEYIFSVYWKPLYTYLVRKGIPRENAKDHTQDFLLKILYEKDFLSKADPERGKFRTFLLTSFDNHIKSSIRKTKKHDSTSSYSDLEFDLPEHVPNDPAKAFDYIWAVNILEKALTSVKTQCYENKLEIHWNVFDEKLIKPLMENVKAPSMSELCSRYDIGSESTASNMLVTVKRRLKKTLTDMLAGTFSEENSDDNYLNHFIEFFG